MEVYGCISGPQRLTWIPIYCLQIQNNKKILLFLFPQFTVILMYECRSFEEILEEYVHCVIVVLSAGPVLKETQWILHSRVSKSLKRLEPGIRVRGHNSTVVTQVQCLLSRSQMFVVIFVTLAGCPSISPKDTGQKSQTGSQHSDCCSTPTDHLINWAHVVSGN